MERAKDIIALAEQGKPEYQTKLGVMHKEGKGVPYDFEKAMNLFKLAAEQDYAEGQYNLGFIYETANGFKNYNKAIELYKKASAQGHDLSSFRIGMIFYLAEEEENLRDYREALKWFLLAAKQGYTNVQFLLGSMYFKGEGTPESPMHAYMWLSIAKANGISTVEVQKLLDEVTQELTPDKLIEAQWHAAKCMSSGYQNCD